MAETLTTKEVAEALDTTPKTLRRFIRSDVKSQGGEVGVDTPGKGKRYAFEKGDVPKMLKQFAKWQKAQAEAAAARRAKAAEAEESADAEDEGSE